MKTTPLPSDRTTIISMVRTAFRSVERGEITLHEGKVLDDRGTAEELHSARRRDDERTWEEVPKSVLSRYLDGVAFLDPTSFRYYMAAYMCFVLEDLEELADSLVPDITIYGLLPSDEEQLRDRKMEKFALFTPAQREAVTLFLHFVARSDLDHVDTEAAKRALERYWDPNGE